MRERMAILDQQLSQLEAEKGFVEDGFKEINRRHAVLDEVEGWNLSTEPDDAADCPETDQIEFDSEKSTNGSSPLIRYSREYTAGL